MEPIKLTSQKITVEHPNGQTYTLEDPIEFVIQLTERGLLAPNGEPNKAPETITNLRLETMKAFGFPNLSFPQLLQILNGITEFVGEFQKKTSLVPPSPNAMDSSPRRMPKG